MRKIRLLVTLLCLFLGIIPALAQSVKIVEEMKQVPYASVMAMYKNEFGSFEKPVMSPSFPYAVIRMHLEGNAPSVRAAKERMTLYMGQQTGVESRVTTYSNQILFLVRAPRHPMIYIDCGDGCERVLLSNMQQLEPNCLYDCTVRFVPEELNVEEVIDKEKLKQELLAELAAVLKDQGSNDFTQNADLLTSTPSNSPISEPNKDSYDTPDLLPNKHNGHEYVDLGLSVKWATCNVGANKPEEYGDYFAWGEIRNKSNYSETTYLYKAKSTTLPSPNDAAKANWGGNWRMPTMAEFDELRNNCTWIKTIQNGVNGYNVTSKSNGNSIFLPTAGVRREISLYSTGVDGYYWSSSLSTGFPNFACYLFFSSRYATSYVSMGSLGRFNGFSIRPVCP